MAQKTYRFEFEDSILEVTFDPSTRKGQAYFHVNDLFADLEPAKDLVNYRFEHPMNGREFYFTPEPNWPTAKEARVAYVSELILKHLNKAEAC